MEENSRLRAAVKAQNTELAALRAVRHVAENLSNLLEIDPLVRQLTSLTNEIISSERTIVLLADKDSASLEYGASHPEPEDTEMRSQLRRIYINTFNVSDTTSVHRLSQGQHLHFTHSELSETEFAPLGIIANEGSFTMIPLLNDQDLMGVLVIHSSEKSPLSEQQVSTLKAISTTAAKSLENARRHGDIIKQLGEKVNELNILQQVDAELNDTIDLPYVFRMIMDWALRFTNADAASIALYDPQTDTVTIREHYGYRYGVVDTNRPLPDEQLSITRRVARSGKSEIVPDVMLDKDYISLADNIRSQLSVPIMREDRVIAIITLESKKINGFSDEHLTFVEKLARRAGVAVDNASLFTETSRERQKLTTILRNIADIVIVVGLDNRVVLVNDSALLGLRLALDGTYVGEKLSDIMLPESVREVFRRASELDEGLSEELELPNGRTYHAKIEKHSGIGWIIVMQDVTPYKETEALKNELVATVSHDLKQPLSVMRGYLDLLQMTNDFDEKSQRYMANLNFAFYSMRQLIDDLLDLARIEAGLQLEIQSVNMKELLAECIDIARQSADEKFQKLSLHLPDEPIVMQGDPFRLKQIFNNLITNAIKYTSPEGWIQVSAEVKQNHVRVSVQDNGMGISPEDQAQIFNRFYRARRPETDSIDGTGLGLAIVKSLVEAHRGQIDLKSQIGQGSTFRVSLPLY